MREIVSKIKRRENFASQKKYMSFIKLEKPFCLWKAQARELKRMPSHCEETFQQENHSVLKTPICRELLWTLSEKTAQESRMPEERMQQSSKDAED